MKNINKTKTINKIIPLYQPSTVYTVTLPLMDKLSGVVDLPDKQYAGIVYSSLIEAFQTGSKDIVQCKPSKGYAMACKMFYPDLYGEFGEKPHSLFFEIKIPSVEKAQARFDFNPYHFSPAAWQWLDEVFLDVPFGMTFRQFLAHARFTRVDVQRLIKNCNPSDFLFHGKWKKQSRSYTSEKNGLETLYLGSSRSNQISIYNKKAQQEPGFEGKGESRIECRQKINYTLVQLKHMKDPFALINITSLECANPPLGVPHWRAFQDSCKLRGTKGALDHQPHKVRGVLKKALAANKVTWWSMAPDDWKVAWDAAIAQAGLNDIPQTAPPLTMEHHSGSDV